MGKKKIIFCLELPLTSLKYPANEILAKDKELFFNRRFLFFNQFLN